MSFSQRSGGLSAHSQPTSSPPGTTSQHTTLPLLLLQSLLSWSFKSSLSLPKAGENWRWDGPRVLVWYRKPKGKCKRDMSTVRRQAILCSSSSVIFFDVIYYIAVGKQSQGYVDRHRRSQLSSNNSLKNSSVFETIQISSVAGYPKEHAAMLRSLRTE